MKSCEWLEVGCSKITTNYQQKLLPSLTTPLAKPNRAFQYKKLQGVIMKPLEALYRHLQGQPFHDYLLKLGVVLLMDYSK
jgi:hypothetical protein